MAIHSHFRYRPWLCLAICSFVISAGMGCSGGAAPASTASPAPSPTPTPSPSPTPVTDAQFRATLIDSTFGRDAVLRVNLAGSGNEASGTLTFNTGVVLPLTGTVTPERDQRKVTLRGENSSIKADFYAYLPTPSSFNNILIKVDYQNLADGPFYALLVGGFD